MKGLVDSLDLTFGQVARAVCAGLTPDQITLDRLRHLRQLGVPFSRKEQGSGSGNRQSYGFDHLVECAIGIYAIRQRFKPTDVAEIQVKERTALRKLAREEFMALPDSALLAPWVKSRGRDKPPQLEPEQFLRLHDKVLDDPGTYDVVTIEELLSNSMFSFGDLVERFPNGETVPLIPLKRVMLPALAWALEAPMTKPGPQ